MSTILKKRNSYITDIQKLFCLARNATSRTKQNIPIRITIDGFYCSAGWSAVVGQYGF